MLVWIVMVCLFCDPIVFHRVIFPQLRRLQDTRSVSGLVVTNSAVTSRLSASSGELRHVSRLYISTAGLTEDESNLIRPLATYWLCEPKHVIQLL